MTTILGVSAEYHDAAAALLVDGVLVAAAEEERFTRIKHDPALPVHAMAWCLAEGGIGPGGIDHVAYYDKPLTTYERILSTHAKVGPRGLPTLARAVSTWSRSKLWLAPRLDRALVDAGHEPAPITFVEHHQSHAASAFYPSPFPSAAVLTFDGVGEWATTSIGHGSGSRLRLLQDLSFPDSIGLLYSAFTSYCGFEVNDGEYKLMGLAPYGEPRFASTIREHLVDIAPDGSLRIDQRWFDYRAGRRMTHPRLAALLEGPARDPGQPVGQREADLAASIQVVVEDVVLRIARHAHAITGEPRACLAGGVALNCVANAALRRHGPFDEVWVQPAAGDAGGAIGAALWTWHQLQGNERHADGTTDAMAGAFLGPAYDDDEIAAWLTASGVAHERLPSLDAIAEVVAGAIADGGTAGWFQGRMEFGPRALGHRSILADPRDPTMAARLNLAVKNREDFRPFAPAVLAEHAGGWFELDQPSPYMLFTAPVSSASVDGVDGADDAEGPTFGQRLGAVHSAIPACTHVDGSARVQTVDATNPELRSVLEAFHRKTRCPVLLNTSFNGNGEPIVRSPADALRCFRRTGLDVLALGTCLVRRPPGDDA